MAELAQQAIQTPPIQTSPLTFEGALAQISARAGELDANPRFPSENLASLMAVGTPQLAADRAHCALDREIALIRALASADASTARILDGHFNGVERLALLAPDELRACELAGVSRGELLLGVWGADPAPGEGPPASIVQSHAGNWALRGVKTFCSGAGGVQRALVIARDEHGARRLAYLDVSSAVRIDRDWYSASGLRSSESHRVEFLDTPILAVLGGTDEIMREPWFSRDAIRTASTWAGIADCILRMTIDTVGDRALDDIRLHAIGRMRVAQSSIDRWLEHCVARVEEISPALAAECRVALTYAARVIAAEAARVCGSRGLVGGGTLDRARRDLDLFLLQHRLDPKLVELGGRMLEEGSR
jgi:alkylation response protein AidB-like acyl-CoA dehydrogenase